MRVSEHANYLLNEYGRLQFDYAAYCKPNGESLRNEARNNLEEYIAELEAERRWIPVRLSKTLTLGAMAGVGVELTGADVEALVRTITGMGEEIRTLNARIAELEAHIAALEEAADIEEWDDFPNFPEPPEVK
jgi:outer membrane murein-binding lipoprotein Lpp